MHTTGNLALDTFVQGLNLDGFTGLKPAAQLQPTDRGWYYDTSVYPPRLVVPEAPVIEDCADGTPQDVWANLWGSLKAREHYATCPHCRRWDQLENRW